MGRSLKPLTGLDAAFLYLESAGTPMHVGSVMLIELPARRGYDFHQALMAHVTERLPRAPALRRVLHEAPLDLGHPMWADAPNLDLKQHIRKRRLPGKGGHARLMTLVGKLHSQALSRDLPMWQFVVIDNVEPARSTVSQFANLLRSLPATLKLVGSVGQAASLINSLRENVLLAPNSVFNRKVGPGRTFGAISLPLDEVKRVARGFGVSLNDVVMAICSGALRELLLTADALPKESLIAAMPVSLRETGNTDANNQVSMVQCSLATDVADPVARLQAIRASTAQIKRRVATVRNLIPTDFPGLAAPIWAAGLSRLWASGRIAERLPALANVAISNVPGPPVPLYLAGAKLRHYYPVSIVTHGLAFNITVQSYAGNLEFGLTACKDVVARPDIVARAMATALSELSERLP